MKYLAHSSREEIPEQPYREHISGVHRMAVENASWVASYTRYAQLLQATVENASVFHDMGKLDDENQKALRISRERLPINHVDGGVAYLLSNPSPARNLSALCVYSHHRGLPSIPAESAKGSGMIFRDEKLKVETDKLLAVYVQRHLSSIADIPESTGTGLYGGSLSTLLMRMALSCLVDADHADTARHYNNVVPEGEVQLLPEERLGLLDRYVDSLGKSDGSNKVRGVIRRMVYDSCRNAKPAVAGIIACDSPVGTGKTTAVMAHLLNVAGLKGLRRVFVVLPFTNIIDQSVDIYRKAMVKENETGIAEKVVAAHHHRAEFEDLETRAFSFLWNAPVTVTTAVQFFETLASSRPAALRKLHNLAGSAIFIDEAHAALPAHLWPQAWRWLNGLVKDWGCYIVVASGSLTRFWKLPEFSSPPVELDELVSEEARKKAFEGETSRVKYGKTEEALSLERLCGWINEMPGPRLVIMNTVQSAAAVARRLAENGKSVEHLSTALAPVHRLETMKRVRKRLTDEHDSEWTLVATSCVEAGVDFSFRSAARETCSLVSVIQTAGRVNRSGEFGESCLWSFRIMPGDGLKEHPQFRVSSAILDDLFVEDKVGSEFCTDAMTREVRARNSGNCMEDPMVRAELAKDFPEVENMFRVIDKNTLTVVVDAGFARRIEEGEIVSPAELQKWSVNIYSYLRDAYALMPFNSRPGLYKWTLAYDGFIGYMAGVLDLVRHGNEGTII